MKSHSIQPCQRHQHSVISLRSRFTGCSTKISRPSGHRPSRSHKERSFSKSSGAWSSFSRDQPNSVQNALTTRATVVTILPSRPSCISSFFVSGFSQSGHRACHGQPSTHELRSTKTRRQDITAALPVTAGAIVFAADSFQRRRRSLPYVFAWSPRPDSFSLARLPPSPAPYLRIVTSGSRHSPLANFFGRACSVSAEPRIARPSSFQKLPPAPRLVRDAVARYQRRRPHRRSARLRYFRDRGAFGRCRLSSSPYPSLRPSWPKNERRAPCPPAPPLRLSDRESRISTNRTYVRRRSRAKFERFFGYRDSAVLPKPTPPTPLGVFSTILSILKFYGDSVIRIPVVEATSGTATGGRCGGHEGAEVYRADEELEGKDIGYVTLVFHGVPGRSWE